MQKKVAHERSLKLNAFHKVDDLHIQISEYEEKQSNYLDYSGKYGISLVVLIFNNLSSVFDNKTLVEFGATCHSDIVHY